MVKFTANKEEVRTISKIAARATAWAMSIGVDYPHMDACMDLEAVHSNGYPLRLDELLAADEFNFAHDVGGIRRHLNRETGQLEDCFVPRYAVPCAEPTCA